MRLLIATAVIFGLVLIATPAAEAAKYKSCGNATVHGAYNSGISYFRVKNTSCKVAVRTMRAYLDIGGVPKVVNGWKITSAHYVFHGRKGHGRFTCAIFGTD